MSCRIFRLDQLGNTARDIGWLAVPLILNNIFNTGMQLTDTAMAGQIGPQDLAAIAVGGSLYVPLFLFSLGILAALSPTIAHLYGAGKKGQIGYYSRQGLWLGQILAWILVLLLENLEPFLHFLHLAPSLAGEAARYAGAMAWGLPAMNAFMVFRFTSEGVGHTRPMLFIALLGFLINIPADYVLVFGKLGFPALGAVGCGWASALVMWLDLAAILVYIWWKKSVYGPFGLFTHFEGPHWMPLAELLRFGGPIAIMLFAEVSLFALTGLMMAKLGTSVAAAHQIAMIIITVMFMVPLGISSAIGVRVGQAAGAGDFRKARRAGLSGIALCVGFEFFSAILLALLAAPITALFTHVASVRLLATHLLWVGAAFQISDGLQVASAGALRGLKDTRVPMLITTLAYWGIGLPIAWGLGLKVGWGPLIVWAGLVAGLSVAGLLLAVRFLSRSKAQIKSEWSATALS